MFLPHLLVIIIMGRMGSVKQSNVKTNRSRVYIIIEGYFVHIVHNIANGIVLHVYRVWEYATYT